MKEIIAGDRYVHPIKHNGDVVDIVKGIMDADKCGVPYVVDFAPDLQGESKYDTCLNIYRFIRENIPYNEDEEGKQWIQSPGELWNNRYTSSIDENGDGGTGEGGDCKSFSMLCSALLKANGIWDLKYRFVSEIPTEDLYHVYIIVRNDDGDGYIILDCTLPEFNYELRLAKLMDVDPAPASAICPFPQPVAIGAPKMGADLIGAQYIFNTSLNAEQNSGDMWAAHEYSYKTSELNPQGLKAEIIYQIKQHFISQPTKQNGAASFINDNWDHFLKTAALMIYHYWGDPGLEQVDFRGKPIPPLAEVDIRIGATEITVKQQVGRDFYDDLASWGISAATIKKLVQLSCWNNHGITMSYMLYRCYNKLYYGQEWGTIPGVPYYDANTKIFYPNGAHFADYINLVFAFPLEGGTGKPWGIPYVSRGVFVMTNGATETAIKALTDQINRQGWNGYINETIFRGTRSDDWEASKLTEAKALEATTIYYNWLAGQLPVLYAAPVAATSTDGSQGVSIVLSGSRGPQIGFVQAVAALIVGISSAVVALLAAILGFIGNLKTNQARMQAHPAIAPADFKMQYQTADGCYIGYYSQCSSGVAKMCKDGAKVCDPNLQLPENNPLNNNFTNPGCMDPASPYYDPLATQDDGSCATGQPKSNMLKYAGYGLLAVGAGTLLLSGDKKK